MLAKLHARLGDFWWCLLMLFCACRATDPHTISRKLRDSYCVMRNDIV